MTMVEHCVALLRERGESITCAESCTGGLLAKKLTDVAGVSAVFPGSIVSYCDRAKAELLGVPQELLAQYGAVSEPVARAMAEGARRRFGTSYALSTTGVAGPDSDERGNPVGTIFVALAGERGTLCLPLTLGQKKREELRQETAERAFSLLWEELRRNEN